MRARWHAFTARIQRLFRLLVLFCILRFVVGIAALVILDRDAVAWGWHLTAITAAAILVPTAVALIIRRESNRQPVPVTTND
jgi:hypothetical protein